MRIILNIIIEESQMVLLSLGSQALITLLQTGCTSTGGGRPHQAAPDLSWLLYGPENVMLLPAEDAPAQNFPSFLQSPN